VRYSFLAFFLLCSSSAFGDLLYGLSTSIPGTVYTVNTATGAATPFVNLTNELLTSLVDITILDGTLYASDVIAGAGAPSNFGSIDPVTGAFTALNQQGGSTNWQALAANPTLGILYAADETGVTVPLISVSPSGAFSTIGNTNIQISDLAYDSVHGILYAVDDSDNLYTVNVTTAAATLIGSTGLGNQIKIGLGYDSNNNVLYANFVGNHSLYTLNTTTGAATLVGANGTTVEIDGLADFGVVSITPEPATIALIGLGLGALVCYRRRPKRQAGR